MVGGYIRFYGIDKKLTHINWRRYSIFLFIVLIFARFFLGVLNFKFTFLKINAASVYELNSLLILILAVSIFFWFLNLHLEKNMFVNNLASTMFGVYLISDHPIVRSLIWHNLFHNALFSNSIYLIWHCFWVIPTVFFVCAFIDWLRLKLIEKPLMYKYGYMIDMWQGHMDSFDIPKLFK
jgi:hypothetical protein